MFLEDPIRDNEIGETVARAPGVVRLHVYGLIEDHVDDWIWAVAKGSHRIELVFPRQRQREEERAVFLVEFHDEHRSPIGPRRGGCYVPKRARFRVLLPLAQKRDREARLIGVDQLGAEFAQPDSIACRAALLLRQGGVVSLGARPGRRGRDMRRLFDIDGLVFRHGRT